MKVKIINIVSKEPDCIVLCSTEFGEIVLTWKDNIPEKDKEYDVELTRELALDLLAHRKELGIKTITVENKHHVWANQASNDLPEFLPNKLRDDQILTATNLTGNPIAMTIQYEPEHQEEIIKAVNEKYGDFVEPRVWGGPYKN